MATGFKCYNCGKGIMVGHNVSHAKNRTRKIFKPNLHGARIVVEGRSMKVRLCTKCLRQIKNPKLRNKSKNQNVVSSDISSAAPVASGLT